MVVNTVASMSIASTLRKLVEYQYFDELKQVAQSCWYDTQEVELLPLLAIAYAYLDQQHLAEEFLTKALARYDELATDARCDLAAALFARNRIDEAEQELIKILAEQAGHSLASARLAFCRLFNNDLQQTISLFQQSLSVNPHRPAVHYHLIKLLIRVDQKEAAQLSLDEAVRTLPTLQNDIPEEIFQRYWHQFNLLQADLWLSRDFFAETEQWLEQLFSAQKAGTYSEADFVDLLIKYSEKLAEKGLHAQASEVLQDYLKKYSNNTSLYSWLAKLAEIQGHFMQAVRLLEKALRIDPGNFSLWLQLANVSLHRNDKMARQAAEKALELADQADLSDNLPASAAGLRQAQAKSMLAQVESYGGNYDVAEKLFREALDKQPAFVPALQGLGQQKMQTGDIDEALRLFTEIKTVDPVIGLSSLISVRRYPDDTESLEKLEAFARKPNPEGPVRAGLLFHLAAAWERRKNYEKAFELAALANRTNSNHISYDARSYRNRCARIRLRFSREFYQHRSDFGVDSSLPVYVIGMPRSGTSLVEQILAGHSKIFGAGELGIIPERIQGINRWERHVGSGRSYPDCVDDISARVIAEVANGILQELQSFDPAAMHVIDKLPHNFENAGLIKLLFPNAKIISVRRDPRDIAISNYFTDFLAKHGGMGFAYDLTDIGKQLADHNLLMDHWHRVFPGEILEINYEDVIEDLEASARAMLTYIGVDWQPQVLDFNTVDRVVKTASVWQVRQPLYKTSKNKWQNYSKHLAALLAGTNATIKPDPYKMLSLPEPGLLTSGVELYNKGKLDDAERCFRKMLQLNPKHAASLYMLGLVYMSKKHCQEGIEYLEQAVCIAPWQKAWFDVLNRACKQEGEPDRIKALRQKIASRAQPLYATLGKIDG